MTITRVLVLVTIILNLYACVPASYFERLDPHALKNAGFDENTVIGITIVQSGHFNADMVRLGLSQPNSITGPVYYTVPVPRISDPTPKLGPYIVNLIESRTGFKAKVLKGRTRDFNYNVQKIVKEEVKNNEVDAVLFIGLYFDGNYSPSSEQAEGNVTLSAGLANAEGTFLWDGKLAESADFKVGTWQVMKRSGHLSKIDFPDKFNRIYKGTTTAVRPKLAKLVSDLAADLGAN